MGTRDQVNMLQVAVGWIADNVPQPEGKIMSGVSSQYSGGDVLLFAQFVIDEVVPGGFCVSKTIEAFIEQAARAELILLNQAV